MHCSGDVAVVGTYDGLVMVLDGIDERKVPKGTELVPCGPPVIGGMQASSPSKSPGGGAQKVRNRRQAMHSSEDRTHYHAIKWPSALFE